jgi:inorganic pyrophosphatase
LKLEYDREIRLFTVSRGLPLGMVYPFDWGFLPGTMAADGDPVDALAIHPSTSYPGVLLPCRLLGMVELAQKDKNGRAEINNRVIATPAWHQALKGLQEARDLPRSVQEELERFFVAVTAFTGKKIKILGWASRGKAQRFIEERQLSRKES